MFVQIFAQMSKTYQSPNIWREKNPASKRLGGGTLNTSNFSGFHPSKTAWTLDCARNWVFMLEPACTRSMYLTLRYRVT